MFDISWSEFLLIGVVALVVIGPKELPAVMRTLGQWTRKVRGMASEFQNQFQEAMREAEMTDLKKQVDDLAQGVKDSVTGLDPLKDVRADIENVGDDVKRSLSSTPEAAVPSTPEVAAALPAAGAEPTLSETPAEPPAPVEAPLSLEAPAMPAPAQTPPPEAPREQPAGELESVGAEAPQSTDKAAQPEETGRSG
jgi:sec-independent protein translocase protein TatB